MKKASFSLLDPRSTLPDHQPLFGGSVMLFFAASGNGIRFPIHAFILNLVLSVMVALVFLFFLLEVIVISPGNVHAFPSKLYCLSFIEGSILIELDAQLIHVVGSALLIFGAIKRNKILCYAYVVCSMLSFVASSIIRTAQVFICDKKQHPKMLPLKYRPDLPEYFKLILMWLVCQLLWYWLVFGFVMAQLEWFKTWPVEEEIALDVTNTPGKISSKRSIRA